jgi:tetratricopeptide (TPR) repeat protein
METIMDKKTLTILFIASALALALLLAVVFPNQAKPLLDRETMLRANQLYENGRYNEAMQTYKQLVDQDYADSALFYNLGNAHYRRGDLGKAILNYERAARLAPRDGDIQANLTYARSQAIDQYATEADSPLVQWTQAASSKLTLNEMSILTLVLFWVLTGLFILYWHTTDPGQQKALRYALVITLLVFALSAFTLGERVYTERTNPSAVVTVESVDVVSNPGEGSITQVTLHSGAPVILLEIRGQWERLSLPGDQFQGWVPVGTVEKVDF